MLWIKSLKSEVLVHSTIQTNQQQLKGTPSWPEAVDNMQVFPFVQSVGCSINMFRPQKYFLCFLWCWLVQFKFQSTVKLIWSSLYGMTSLIIFGNPFRKLILLAGKCWLMRSLKQHTHTRTHNTHTRTHR